MAACHHEESSQFSSLASRSTPRPCYFYPTRAPTCCGRGCSCIRPQCGPKTFGVRRSQAGEEETEGFITICEGLGTIKPVCPHNYSTCVKDMRGTKLAGSTVSTESQLSQPNLN